MEEILDYVLKQGSFFQLTPGQFFFFFLPCCLQVISKDSNVVVVALAGNVITGLAKGLRKKFSAYAPFLMSAIFEKFKEKKLNVVNSLREASDAVYLTVCNTIFEQWPHFTTYSLPPLALLP